MRCLTASSTEDQPQAVLVAAGNMRWLLTNSVILLQLVDFPEASGPRELHYDAEWLAILRTTHHLMSLQRRPVTLPGAQSWHL